MIKVSLLSLLALALALPACAKTPPPNAAVREQRLAARAAAERGELRSERVRASFSDPKELAVSLRRIFEAGSPGAQVSDILVDDVTGELVLLGTEGGTAAVRALVESLNRREAPGDASVEVVALQHAEARDVAKALSPMLPGGLHLSADLATNRLVMSGGPQERQSVKRLIAELDAPRRPK